TANFFAPSRNARRSMSPCTYLSKRSKSSCGNSDAFFRSMMLLSCRFVVRIISHVLRADGQVGSLPRQTGRRTAASSGKDRGCWHLVPRPSFEFAPVTFFQNAAPLFEEKRDSR